MKVFGIYPILPRCYNVPRKKIRVVFAGEGLESEKLHTLTCFVDWCFAHRWADVCRRSLRLICSNCFDHEEDHDGVSSTAISSRLSVATTSFIEGSLKGSFLPEASAMDQRSGTSRWHAGLAAGHGARSIYGNDHRWPPRPEGAKLTVSPVTEFFFF